MKNPTALDRVDRRLLRLLQADGRLTIAELARQVHLTATPCLERIKRLEREGYIRGYSAELEPALLGAGLIAFVQIQLDRTTPDVFNRFRERIATLDPVQECHMVAGGFDYLLKVRVADMSNYRRFLEDLAALPGIEQTHTYVVMEELKSSRAITIPD
jgi:Lrp/AsnC family leucine-responsive transcriptional regulator